MPRSTNDLLRRALVAPQILAGLQLSDWDHLLPEARIAGLLARIDALLEEGGLLEEIPQQVRPHLIAARRIASSETSTLGWEVNRIGRALASIDSPIILLKGAAYVVQGLPIARGRMSSDVDILAPKDVLGVVESALLNHGWEHVKLDDYDQYFYRHWSHELPPLQHRDRGTIVDVHHTILPPTGRLHPDPEKLIAASLPVEGTMFRVLAPHDMVLHSAAHAFQDGDLTRGLRDLVDIDDLLRYFSEKDEGFWDRLTARANELELGRPLYYALCYSHIYLRTPIPGHVLERAQRWRPAWPASILMDAVVDKVITAGPWHRDAKFKLSQKLLYIRSHWLRMPPRLLAKHLLVKLLRRWNEGKQE